MSDARISALLSEMTLEEKVSLLSGASLWRTVAIERLGIPAIKVSDGPNAVRGEGVGRNTSACFPVGSALAATWDEALIGEVGEALADEAKSKCAQVVLGPTINLQRTPIGGRNFECYSEDPYLTGRMAVSFVKSMQSQGIGACPKHYVCNDTEADRHHLSSDVDEQPLHELYLRPFEMVVKEADPWTIMSSYNRVNGEFAPSSKSLSTDLLKDTWGWPGMMMSDWRGATETVGNALGGLDLEMPGPAQTFGEKLVEAVKKGDVPEEVIDDKVRRMLNLLSRSGALDEQPNMREQTQDQPSHRDLARRSAAAAMVLLKNEGVLPLSAPKGSVAVIGPNAMKGQIQGGGSSGVKPHYTVTPYDGVVNAASGVTVTYAQGCTTHKYCAEIETSWLRPDDQSEEQGFAFAFYPDGKLDGEPTKRSVREGGRLLFGGLDASSTNTMAGAKLKAILRVPESGAYTFGLMSAGLSRMRLDGAEIIDNWTHQEPGESFFSFGSTEKCSVQTLEAGRDYQIEVDLVGLPGRLLTGVQVGLHPPVGDNLLEEAVALAKESEQVILCLGTNSDWETEGNDRETLDLPGEQEALARAVIAANPNTVVVVNSGSVVAMDWLDAARAVLWTWFPGQEFGNAMADIIYGQADPGGRLPLTIPRRLQDTPAYSNYPGAGGHMRYGEGLFVGYRWYQKRDIEPLFPFGFGLSYGQYELNDLQVSPVDGQAGLFEVTVEVANTGSRAGESVVQAYVAPLEVGLMRPVRELKGFAKVKLAAGERQRIAVALDDKAFSNWDIGDGDWSAKPGRYRIDVGFSSEDLVLSAELDLP